MDRASLLQERPKMLFEEVYSVWTERRLTQEEAAQLLGVCPRTFRRWAGRYEEFGIDGLRDKRLSGLSHRAAPVDEVMRLVDRYRTRHEGWNVRHFYSWYRRDGGQRSYGWVKDKLQQAGAVAKSKGRGKHRKRRERSPWPGMLRPGSRTSNRPTGTCGRCTCRLSMRSSPSRPARRDRRSFLVRTWRGWTTFSARFTNARSAGTIACGSSGGSCNCPRTVTGPTTPRSG